MDVSAGPSDAPASAESAATTPATDTTVVSAAATPTPAPSSPPPPATKKPSSAPGEEDRCQVVIGTTFAGEPIRCPTKVASIKSKTFWALLTIFSSTIHGTPDHKHHCQHCLKRVCPAHFTVTDAKYRVCTECSAAGVVEPVDRKVKGEEGSDGAAAEPEGATEAATAAAAAPVEAEVAPAEAAESAAAAEAPAPAEAATADAAEAPAASSAPTLTL